MPPKKPVAGKAEPFTSTSQIPQSASTNSDVIVLTMSVLGGIWAEVAISGQNAPVICTLSTDSTDAKVGKTILQVPPDKVKSQQIVLGGAQHVYVAIRSAVPDTPGMIAGFVKVTGLRRP